jgi:hypothetical protein
MSLPDDRNPRPSVQPTRPSTLVVAGLGAAALSWLMISRLYNEFPDLPWLPALTLLGLAALEFAAAANTKARIDRRKGLPPVDPLLVAKFVVLAKASALAGALFAGMYGGFSVWLLTEIGRLEAAETDLPPALTGLVGAVALTIGALLLERACRVPPPPSSDPAQPGRSDEREDDQEQAEN